MNTTSDMEIISIDKLIPYANNARTHSKEQIKKLQSSLHAFGFINPVIIDRQYNVIAGHGRILAAREENMTEVPCVYVDHLSEAQKKAYILADNRMALDAGWDEEMLRAEIEQLNEMAFDVSLTGFDAGEIEKILALPNEVQDDTFDLSSALEKASFVEAGDVWTVGRHRLVCGDATKAEDVALLMDGKKANLLLTDPPYGVSFKSSSGLTIQNDSMKNDEFYGFLKSAFDCAAQSLEAGGSAYVFHADTEGLNFRKAFVDAGFHLAGCCIWVKDSLVLGRSDYQWQHEPVLYGFLQNDSMNNDELYRFIKESFDCAAQSLESGGSAYVFNAGTDGLNFIKDFVDDDFNLSGCCIWVNDSLVLVRSDYQLQHEPVLYGFLKNGKHHWFSDRKQTTIWNFAKPKKNSNHPTSKPLDLLSYPIQNSTQENAIVLDTFGGSGSTMMACEKTNRICYMMELDPKYASVILRRAVEDGISPDDVFVERAGEKIQYCDLVKEV